MEIDGDVEETSRRVQVRFTTKLQSPFKTPPTSIAIPSNLTRMGLSAIVNNLLKSGIIYIHICFLCLVAEKTWENNRKGNFGLSSSIYFGSV